MSKFPLLFCSKLTKYYQYKKIFIKVLCNITLMIERGDIIAIIGSSGSGKSTFLHLLGGLEKPSSGKILFLNYVLNKLSDSVLSEIRNKHVGFIYQFHHLLPDFNIVENVAMPLFIGGLNFCKAKVRARNMLELVGLKNRLHHYLHELSGGESQRVAIARALINRPDIVLADEPTGSLDQDTTEHIFQLLQKLNVLYGTTFVIATHNLILAKKCHKIYVMRDGALVLQN